MFTGTKGAYQYEVTPSLNAYNAPRVSWKRVGTAHTKEGTPIDFLESGISCPEVHEYFSNYVSEQEHGNGG